MSTAVITCVCTQCSHELRQDCINMDCDCCKREDAQQMLSHKPDD